ncbi:unnamed protein product [Lepeophtheirus salmonis]|uniref:(salmon louse) hypothetical protein n=1 Tax=Lepeophtheirus salmonis TaxID=72036 RepID=A0A7R8HDT5_LEPSM|nr:unnamed protein product [Lepeophtheirus salmonis]CAF3031640.1 unnamed protein product [Lepeophtheirus salmonis]
MMALPAPAYQKAYRSVDGTSENLCVLQGVLEDARTSIRPLSIAFVDFSKAFGSISHESLMNGLKRSGAPGALIDYVKYVYKNAVVMVKRGAECRVRSYYFPIGLTSPDGVISMLN